MRGQKMKTSIRRSDTLEAANMQVRATIDAAWIQVRGSLFSAALAAGIGAAVVFIPNMTTHPPSPKEWKDQSPMTYDYNYGSYNGTPSDDVSWNSATPLSPEYFTGSWSTTLVHYSGRK